jgi:2,4-didehydro-3-deoxy-L-rhamnonate hydrolase
VPDEPILFNKSPNTLIGPYDDVRIPRGSTKPDWEVELGIVIGRRTSYLDSVEEARGVIAGYLVVNDVSERAFQIERGGQWVKGKSAETFNPDRELGVAAAARGRAAMSARSMRVRPDGMARAQDPR